MLKILTLNWNGEDKLKKLYPSLMLSLKNIQYQWIIKDNNSRDNSIKFIEEQNNTNVNIIKYNHNNDNFAQGCNFLFKEVNPNSDDYILLLNNDVIFNDENSLNNMISIIKNDHNVGVVGCKLKFTNTDKLQHAGVVFHNNYGFPTHFRANEKDDLNASRNREFQAVTGAVWLTKAKYYENICDTNKSKINGLDENFFWCFEDISACLSIKYDMNKKIVYCGSTNIFHEESATLKKNPVNKLFNSHNLNYLRNKWHKRFSLDRDIYTNDPKYNLYQEKK